MPNPVFACPNCNRLLGDIPPAGVLTAVCAHCRFKYQVVRGRVRQASSRQIAKPGDNSPVRYADQHEVVLDLPSGRSEIVAFAIDHAQGPSPARADEIFSAVYLMRGKSRERLLLVYNANTDARIVLAGVGGMALRKVFWLALGAGLTTGVLAGSATSSGPVTLVGAIGGFAAVVFGLGYRMMPRVSLSADEKARLSAGQHLLAEKLNLETARAAVVRELDSRGELRSRLDGLREKMQRVGLDVYAPRIAALERALAMIDRQIELQRRLRDGYERSIDMLEIELEAGAAADAFDSSAAPHIATILSEMRELEEQQADLARQLSANAEVEHLLRPSSEP